MLAGYWGVASAERPPVPVRDGRRDRARFRLGARRRRDRRDEGADRRRRIPRSRPGRPLRLRGRRPLVPGRRRRRGCGSCRSITFATLLGVSWWASWYPGAEPGGGGYVAQNMLACKDERDARRAALSLQRRALRDPELALGHHRALLARDLRRLGPQRRGRRGSRPELRADDGRLPARRRLRGLMLASFAAAYMSTSATQMNWGSSYLINDLYRRFLKRDAPERTTSSPRASRRRSRVVLSLVATSS